MSTIPNRGAITEPLFVQFLRENINQDLSVNQKNWFKFNELSKEKVKQAVQRFNQDWGSEAIVFSETDFAKLAAADGKAGASIDDLDVLRQQAIPDTLKKIESDPEGKQLVELARQNKVNIRVGDPNELKRARQGAYYHPQRNEIVLSDPSDIRHLAHELGHAALANAPVKKQFLDSDTEEVYVDTLATRIHSRITRQTAAGVRRIKKEQAQHYAHMNLPKTDPKLNETIRSVGLETALEPANSPFRDDTNRKLHRLNQLLLTLLMNPKEKDLARIRKAQKLSSQLDQLGVGNGTRVNEPKEWQFLRRLQRVELLHLKGNLSEAQTMYADLLRELEPKRRTESWVEKFYRRIEQDMSFIQ